MAKTKIIPLCKRTDKYMCVGEDFGLGMKIGYCGDIHTLWEWVKELFAEYDADQIDRYYGDATDEHILDAILVYKGKKLWVF